MDLDWYKISIRLYENKDDDFIAELIRKNFDKSYCYHKKPNRECLIVCNDNNPIGFIDWEYTTGNDISNHYNNKESKQFFEQFEDKSILYIHSIAIVEEMQGKGIGSMLLDVIISSHVFDNYIIVALALRSSSGHINSEILFNSFHFQQFDPIEDAWDQSESPVNNCPLCDGDTCKCSAVPFAKFPTLKKENSDEN